MKVKCAQYWSEDGDQSITYGDITVNLIKISKCGDFVRRRFEISKNNVTREVLQFQFIAWPYRGIPVATSSLFRFHKAVAHPQSESVGPIVVHCRKNGQSNEIDHEFEMLNYFPPLDTVQAAGWKTENKHLNCDRTVIPYDHNAVSIKMNPADKCVPYYNASNITSYYPTDIFIAAQTPTSESTQVFWRMILDNKVSMIVSLCELAVSQIYYDQWPEQVNPANSSNILEIIASIERHNRTLASSENKTMLVHCSYLTILRLFSDGSGRTGTFCAISNLIERLKNENRVDILRTVKDLRDQRPMMVRNKGQYEFCYQAVSDFLQSFHLYENFQEKEGSDNMDQ
ncbi:receptor-type tyrosine-protein phosphatase alpha-like [Styela clava]